MSREVLDYVPMIDGATADLETGGGAVTKLRLYATPARDQDPVVEAGPAVAQPDGSYRFTFDLPDPGRYWTEVRWRPAPAADEQVDTFGRVDLPSRADLLVSPEDVATRLGVTLPLTAEQRERLADAILDAQADVEDALNRDLVPRVAAVPSVMPAWGYPVTDAGAWPQVAEYFDDTIRVLTYTANTDGTYDLMVQVGLDGRSERSIVRFVKAHAAESIRLDASTPMGRRAVTSVSAEGQSVSYEQRASSQSGAADQNAGALPTMASLRRFKRYSVFRRRRIADPPWPYAGGRLIGNLRILD